MRNLKELRAIIRREQSAESLDNEELFRVASQPTLPVPAELAAIWAFREGLPVLHELAGRSQDLADLPDMIPEPDAAA